MIIKNSMQCLICEDIVESKSVHDYQQCKCGNLFVDGGLSYIRWGAQNPFKVKDLCEFHEVKTILTLDNGEPYAWDIVQLGKDSNGNYWWRAGSGCSCDWIEEDDWIPLHDDYTMFENAITHCGLGDIHDIESRSTFRMQVKNELAGKTNEQE